MNLKEQIFSNTQKTWVLLTTKPQKMRFSPLIETIDLYNHQHLIRSLKNKKMSLALGEKSMISCRHLLPAQRLVVFGLGTGSELDKTQIQSLIKDVEHTLKDLNEDEAFVAISDSTPPELIESIKKKFKNYLVG